MKTRIWILVLATALAAAPSVAQESSGVNLASVLQALGLPRATQEARILGVPESDIRTILDTARERRLPAGVLTEVFEGGNEAIREHGPIDNFGAFVQARLDAGLRGRELAAAIRAEHAVRGKGKGHEKGPGGPEMAGKKGAAAGPGGRPEGVGKSGAPGGKPAPGKPASADKPDTAKGKKGGPR